MIDLPPLRYLAGDDVVAAMPPLPERLALAELTVRGLAEGAELPPKIGVHPRPSSCSHTPCRRCCRAMRATGPRTGSG